MKSKSVNFITKVSANLEIETKSDVFPWDISKSKITKKKINFKYVNDLSILMTFRPYINDFQVAP